MVRGEPQIYRTRLRCSADGPVPAPPLVDETRAQKYRETVGMGPIVGVHGRDRGHVRRRAAVSPQCPA